MIISAKLRLLLTLYGNHDGLTIGDVEIQHLRLFKFEIRFAATTLWRMERDGLVSRGAVRRNHGWPGRPASLWRLTPSGARHPSVLAYVWRQMESGMLDA